SVALGNRARVAAAAAEDDDVAEAETVFSRNWYAQLRSEEKTEALREWFGLAVNSPVALHDAEWFDRLLREERGARFGTVVHSQHLIIPATVPADDHNVAAATATS